jgi:phosphoglycerate dehydrogenase-like enzyme
MTTIVVYDAFASSAEQLALELPAAQVIDVRADQDLRAAAGAEFALGGDNRDSVRKLLAAAPRLRWYQCIGAGVDQVVPEFRQRDIVLTTNSRAHSVPVAEHAIMFLCAASRQLRAYAAQQQRQDWKRQEHRPLRGATVLIYGLGNIGREVARLANILGMRVIGVRRQGGPVAGVSRVFDPGDLPIAVSVADYLVIAAPLTEATRGAISRNVIARMKSSAWLVNVGRAGIVDEVALIEGLRKTRIAGAALDVFACEPLPRGSPFWTLDNVLITPRSAAATSQVPERSVAHFVDNLRRFKARESLVNQVDFVRGY